MNLTSTKPYFIRAFYEWIADNSLTPYLLVDAQSTSVDVPSNCIVEGKIVLNISPSAIRDLRLHNDCVAFKARFSGVPYDINLPMAAIEAIYAKENGKGMVFPPEEVAEAGEATDLAPTTPKDRHLKLVK